MKLSKLYDARFIFSLVVVLILSSFSGYFVHAEETIGMKWKVDYQGQPVIDPILLKNERLATGSYELINNVYHMDFMTVGPNGDTKNNWSITSGGPGTEVQLVETESGTFYYIWSKQGAKSKLALYSMDGQKNWEIPMPLKVDEEGYPEDSFTYVDEEHSILLYKGGNLQKVGLDGKVISTIDLGETYFYELDHDGNIYSINYESMSLVKSDAQGHKVWEKAVFTEDAYQEMLGWANNQLYVVESFWSGESVLHVFNEDGDEILSYPFENDPILYGLMENEQNVFLIGDEFFKIDKTKHNVTHLESISEYPEDTAMDTNGNLYYTTSQSIVKLNQAGNKEWSKKRSISEDYLSGILTDSKDRLYIYEAWGQQIYQYDPSGNRNWGYDLGYDAHLSDIVVDNLNEVIYVNDAGNGRIVGLTKDGKLEIPKPEPKPSVFKDVTRYQAEIEYLTSIGVIKGYEGGYFKPTDKIKRIQAVQMILREQGYDMDETEVTNPGFADIKPGDYGFKEVALAVELGFISGKTNSKGQKVFDPYGALTRGQMSKILSLAYDLEGDYDGDFTDVPKGDGTYEYVRLLAANEITTGYEDGTFRPNVQLSREHFAVFMARLLDERFR